MKFRNTFLACAAAATLIAAPLYAATLSGKVVAVDENSITVMKDGQSTVYILPQGLQIKGKDNRQLELSQLRGQTVTLTVAEPMHPQGQGKAQEKVEPRVTNIRIDGDVEVDNDSD
jgi:hypothetical protein